MHHIQLPEVTGWILEPTNVNSTFTEQPINVFAKKKIKSLKIWTWFEPYLNCFR